MNVDAALCVGMNPIPDDPAPPAEIIAEIRRARDSAILLAGQRPYRYYCYFLVIVYVLSHYVYVDDTVGHGFAVSCLLTCSAAHGVRRVPVATRE